MFEGEVRYKEFRFLMEEEHTDVYVGAVVKTGGRVRESWHHKTFPRQVSLQEIHWKMFEGEGPVAWPEKLPEE